MGRPKGTGYVREREGRHSCIWKQDGKFIERRVTNERHGERMLLRVEDLREQGLDLHNAVAKAFGEPERPRGTASMKHMAATYLDWLAREGRRTPRNMAMDRSRAKGVTEDPEMAEARVDLVDRAAVARWTERLAQKRQPRTINRHLSLASQVWRYAQRHGYVPEAKANPFRLVGRAREPNLDKDPLSPEEAAALVSAAPEDFRPLLVAALATGCRRGELLSLTWADVDLKANGGEGVLIIRPEREKAGRGRRVPLTVELRAMLSRTKKAAGPVLPSAPVFLTAEGRPFDAQAVRLRVKALRRATPEGVPLRKVTNFQFKGLRDAAVCNLLALGVPTATVARVVGHGSIKTTEKYLGKLVDAQRAAMKAYSAVRFGTAT